MSDALNVHPIVAQLLVNRGVSSPDVARQFLSCGISDLHDPFLLEGMDAAVKRIKQAQKNKERVLIFGDYDVDGVTSSALLYKALTRLGIEVFNHIPHRMHDGYGLNDGISDIIEEKNVQLLITVDCGITSIDEVAALKQSGLDIIIVDHHEPSEEGLPDALAIVDPKRKDCAYPFKHLAAVGLVGKLVQALFGTISQEELDLIVLGTIADVVPLRGENRIFVKEGLPGIHQTKNKGLAALINVAKIKGKVFKPYFVGFILGPRINATGRMGSAKKSLKLLLSQDVKEAHQIAQDLDVMNSDRQKLQREVVKEALACVEQEINFKEHKVIIIAKEGWHKGVLGIVASRLTETYSRPAIVISLEDGVGTASARSIEGFHLHEALESCSEALENFGGHKLAAGLTIREEKIEEFRDLMNTFAQDVLEVRSLVPSVSIDCEVPLSSLSLDLVDKIDSLEPYGEGNPAPVFCSRQLTVKSKPAVLGRETLKFWVTDGEVSVAALGFGMGKYAKILFPGQKVDLAYQVAIDDWNKAPTVMLKLKDIKENED